MIHSKFLQPVLACLAILASSLSPAVLSPTAAREPVRILAFGDSLTAGYGLPDKDGFAAQLADALAKMGRPAVVINGGVSGDTSAGGAQRIDWALADKPEIVILELGANDALRGLDPSAMKANLQAIAQRAKASGAQVLLAGMLAPRNLGPDYVAAYDAVFPELAKAESIDLYPFFLDGVAGDQALNQADGIHPTAEGVAIIVQRLLPSLTKIMDRLPE